MREKRIERREKIEEVKHRFSRKMDDERDVA